MSLLTEKNQAKCSYEAGKQRMKEFWQTRQRSQREKLWMLEGRSQPLKASPATRSSCLQPFPRPLAFHKELTGIIVSFFP